MFQTEQIQEDFMFLDFSNQQQLKEQEQQNLIQQLHQQEKKIQSKVIYSNSSLIYTMCKINLNQVGLILNSQNSPILMEKGPDR